MARITSVAISYLKNSLPSQKNSLARQTRWLDFVFSSTLSATFQRLLFHSHSELQQFTYRSLTNETCNSTKVLPTPPTFSIIWSFAIWGMLVSVSMFPSNPCFYCGKKQSEPGPRAHLHPMETGIWLQIFTPFYLSCYPAVMPPSLSFTAILLPSVPSLLERKLQLQALYLNQCHNDTFPLAQLTCNHELPRLRTKTFPHTEKAAFNCGKGLTFLKLYEIPLHVSMCFSGMVHGALWKYIKLQQTGQKPPCAGTAEERSGVGEARLAQLWTHTIQSFTSHDRSAVSISWM